MGREDIAAISGISGLKRDTEVIEHREGGDPSTSRKSPGRTKFSSITLKRGLTQDTAFEDWANLTWQLGVGRGTETHLKEFRKDIYLEFLNEAGQLVIAYKIDRCWLRLTKRCQASTQIPTTLHSSKLRWSVRGGRETLLWSNPLSLNRPPLRFRVTPLNVEV